MRKILLSLIVLVVLVGGGWVINDRANFDRSAWLADFAQLKSATEHSYANLRWSRTAKQVDLVTLNAKALQELEQATSNSTARRAIANFVSGFNDGHFFIESGPPRPVAAVMKLFDREKSIELDLALDGEQACGSLDFETTSHELDLEGAAPLRRATFAAGTVTTAGGRRFGVIRIPRFRQHDYGAICQKAWQQFRANKSGTCAEACLDDFSVYAKQEIAQALADDATALITGGAEALIIDLTGNGGGTEWAEFAAAALSPKPLQPAPAAFVRGAHWLKHFAEDLAAVAAELRTVQDPARRSQLQASRAELLAMRDSASHTCDVSALWTIRETEPHCWNDVRLAPAVHSSGQREYLRPYAGRIFIMVDERTASASEQFAALLVDNGRAKTIGEKTMGVGCGFTNGGNPTTLKHSKLVIWMPDCARLRADGSNEFEGITPDYSVAWGDDAAGKTAAVLAVLDKLPKQ